MFMEPANNKQQTTNTVHGLAILRMLMCFEVVLCHFWIYDEGSSYILKCFEWLRPCAVPVFTLMSFFLMGKFFLSPTWGKAEKRFLRLIYPHLAWAIIYWVIMNVLIFIVGRGDLHGITDLLWQIFTGSSPDLDPVMWYQVVLILLTAAFYMIFRRFGDRAHYILSFLLVFATAMQYAGTNYALFCGLRYELKYPLGRTLEMLPYAVMGVYIASFNIYASGAKTLRIIGIVLLSLGLLAYVLHLGNFAAPGFGYSGIGLMCAALILHTVFYRLPLQGVSEKAKRIIEIISRYTLGIYCMHFIVGRVVAKGFQHFGFEENMFAICICIYVLCYILSMIIARIPDGWGRKIVD